MDINKNVLACNLIDCYGILLTEKQQDILKQYYFNDISLSEIAEVCETTRQAVNDMITRSIKILENYENKLQIVKKHKNIAKIIHEIQTTNKLNKLNEIMNILEE